MHWILIVGLFGDSTPLLVDYYPDRASCEAAVQAWTGGKERTSFYGRCLPAPEGVPS